MKPEFVRCEFCKTEIPAQTCKLAAYNTIIDGKQYLFCCKNCATQYEQKKSKTR